MKGMLKLKLKLNCIVVENDHCLDLPSLTAIQSSSDCAIHFFIGIVILESMVRY